MGKTVPSYTIEGCCQCPHMEENNWLLNGDLPFRSCKIVKKEIKDIDEIPVWCPLWDNTLQIKSEPTNPYNRTRKRYENGNILNDWKDAWKEGYDACMEWHKVGKIMCNSCGENPATGLHSCPYSEEINNDYETLCNCCSDCAQSCTDEI
jgi:hypothetical protein